MRMNQDPLMGQFKMGDRYYFNNYFRETNKAEEVTWTERKRRTMHNA